MLEFLRSLRREGRLWVRLPGLPVSFLVAELFYKFHSFALECAAFLATWAVVDVVALRAERALRPRTVPSPLGGGGGRS